MRYGVQLVAVVFLGILEERRIPTNMGVKRFAVPWFLVVRGRDGDEIMVLMSKNRSTLGLFSFFKRVK